MLVGKARIPPHASVLDSVMHALLLRECVCRSGIRRFLAMQVSWYR